MVLASRDAGHNPNQRVRSSLDQFLGCFESDAVAWSVQVDGEWHESSREHIDELNDAMLSASFDRCQLRESPEASTSAVVFSGPLHASESDGWTFRVHPDEQAVFAYGGPWRVSTGWPAIESIVRESVAAAR